MTALERHIDEYLKFNKTLLSLSTDFVWAAQTYGKIIILEKYLPPHKKTIQSRSGGIAGGQKFVIQGIFFKFATDITGLYGWNDYYAAKTANHELKGLICYTNAGVPGLNFPLMCVIDYLGYRLVALTLLPVGSKENSSLIIGTENGGLVHYNIEKGAHEINNLLAKAGEKINIASHIVSPPPLSIRLSSPIDLEGHLGSDGRYYILDFARTLPPVYPEPHIRARRTKSFLYELFRPEFVKTYPKPLCSDGFSDFLSHDPNKITLLRDLWVASKELLKRTIPNFVNGHFLPSVKQAIKEGTLHRFRVTQAMHRAGINMRYLGAVFKEIPVSYLEARLLIFIEALVRQCKINLRQRIQKTMKILRVPLMEPYMKTSLKFFNLVFGNNPESASYHLKLKRQIALTYELVLDPLEEERDLRSFLTSSTILHGPHLLFIRYVLVVFFFLFVFFVFVSVFFD